MKSKKNAARRKARRAAEIAVAIIFEISAAAAAGAAVGMKIIPYAYQERGYFAVGGEWMLMLVIATGAWYAAHKLDAAVWEGRQITHEDNSRAAEPCAKSLAEDAGNNSILRRSSPSGQMP